MIDVTDPTVGLGPLAYAASGAAPPSPSHGQDRPTGRSDQVLISAAAERAASFGGVVTDAVKATDPLTRTRLQDKTLPDLIVDFDTFVDMAETRLGALMADLGMDPNTNVTITSLGNGRFTVDSDHPKAAALEAAINEDDEMRNALIGGHNTAVISRIAAAAAQAMTAADANPDKASTYYAWLMGIANEARAMDAHFTLENGALSGGLIDGTGRRLALTDGLRLPA